MTAFLQHLQHLLCLVGAGLAELTVEAVLWGPGTSLCVVCIPFVGAAVSPLPSLLPPHLQKEGSWLWKQLTNSQRIYKLRVDPAIEASALFFGKPVVISLPLLRVSAPNSHSFTLVFFPPPSFSLCSHSLEVLP